LACRIFR